MEILVLRIRLFFEDRWMDIRHIFRYCTSSQWRNYWRAHKVTEAIWKLKEAQDESKVE